MGNDTLDIRYEIMHDTRYENVWWEILKCSSGEMGLVKVPWVLSFWCVRSFRKDH